MNLLHLPLDSMVHHTFVHHLVRENEAMLIWLFGYKLFMDEAWADLPCVDDQKINLS